MVGPSFVSPLSPSDLKPMKMNDEKKERSVPQKGSRSKAKGPSDQRYHAEQRWIVNKTKRIKRNEKRERKSAEKRIEWGGRNGVVMEAAYVRRAVKNRRESAAAAVSLAMKDDCFSDF